MAGGKSEWVVDGSNIVFCSAAATSQLARPLTGKETATDVLRVG
jgi:hypothetical protein